MVQYSRGDLKGLSKLRKLWVESFNDTYRGFRNFIRTNSKYLRIYIAKSEGSIVAALYHIPCTVNGIKAHYLYGAATQTKHRGKGIMRHLISYSLDDAKALGEKLSVLYPANQHLYGYYGRLGYERKCHRKTVVVSRDDLMNIGEYGGFCPSMGVNQMARFRNSFLKTDVLIFPSEYMKYSVSSTKIYGGKIVCTDKGYAIIEKDENGECIISEFLAEKENVNILLGEVLKNSKAQKFIFNYPASMSLFKNEKLSEDGMIKKLTDCKIDEVYIGLSNG